VTSALPSLLLLGLFLGVLRSNASEASRSENRVKALFVINFAKYVEWPSKAFTSTNSDFVIGVLGESRFGEDLNKAAEGKTIGGRPISILKLRKAEEILACQIVFVSSSEKAHLTEILQAVRSRPVLTVSDIESFAQQGGIIGFLRKDDRIRLEIDLAPAEAAGLQLSAKLLSVADAVHGKH
jgi:hypothetical protein